jgi:hypothetical protein
MAGEGMGEVVDVPRRLLAGHGVASVRIGDVAPGVRAFELEVAIANEGTGEVVDVPRRLLASRSVRHSSSHRAAI